MEKLKFLVVETYYDVFLKKAYLTNKALEFQSYNSQLKQLLDTGFGTADYYTSNLINLGHEAKDIICNCEILQKTWCIENNKKWPNALTNKQKEKRLLRVLKEQIVSFKPDVLYVHNLSFLGADFLNEIRNYVKLIVGQFAYAISPYLDLSPYDILLTSFPQYVDRLNELGLNSKYFKIGFEEKINTMIKEGPKNDYPIVFVGSFSNDKGPHEHGTQMLEYLASRFKIEFWGHGIEALQADSTILKTYHGEAWGKEMYKIFSQAKIVLNRHAAWSENNANNMRLYEATGVGAMLLTDMKDNLSDIFEIGQEVVAYRSQYECGELIEYYLKNESERALIASAGQKRTLSEHTYRHRMEELLGIIEDHSKNKKRVLLKKITMQPVKQPEIFNFDSTLNVAKAIIKKTPLKGPAIELIRRLKSWEKKSFQLINKSEVDKSWKSAWKSSDIVMRQRNIANRELRDMNMGNIPRVFEVAAEALTETGMADKSVIEIGCASGYYYEVLKHLTGIDIDYTGVDYSEALIERAKMEYPNVSFLEGDATRLTIEDSAYDVVISGCVILHLSDYKKAIMETVRISRKWCIFHRTPIIKTSTKYFKKVAYGITCMELAFSEAELLSLFSESGLEVVKNQFIGSHRVLAINEDVESRTYVCRKIA